MGKEVIVSGIKGESVSLLHSLFRIYTNPVSSGVNLNIEVRQAEEGYFILQLLDQSGHIIYRQEIWIDADAGVLNLEIPPVPGGIFFLTLTSKKSGQKFSERIVFQKNMI